MSKYIPELPQSVQDYLYFVKERDMYLRNPEHFGKKNSVDSIKAFVFNMRLKPNYPEEFLSI